MLTLGCHLSKKEGYLFMAKEAVSINANTFQFFTRNPRGGAVAELDLKDIEAYLAYAKEHGIETICGYAPYDIEPASPDMSKRDFAVSVMTQDINRLEHIPGQFYLVRPSSAPESTEEESIKHISATFNQVLDPAQTTTVLVDIQAGEGNQVGYTFEQIAQMLEGIKLADKMGVCVDTSALWAAGYDIKNDLDGVLDSFDSIIGLDKLKAVHLNDSKETLGSKVNRHALIGEGVLGFDTLAAFMNAKRLAGRAFYLEEPHATLVTYERDIERFRKAYTGA